MPCRSDDLLERPHSVPGAHLLVLGLNAALGGLTAALRQHAHDGPFWPSFAQGAAGGAAIYAGKALSAESFWGAGMMGRQVAAVGSSVIRNASEDRPAFGQVVVPLGPVRVYLDRAEDPSVTWRLDLLGSGVLAYRGFSNDSRFDSGASLSAGAPVFNTTRARPGWHGNNTAGIILLREQPPHMQARAPDRELVFAHERIHLLQYDQALHTLSGPLEQRLLRSVPGGAWIARHVDVGLMMVPVMLLNAVIPYEQRPWEMEAHFFSGTGEH